MIQKRLPFVCLLCCQRDLATILFAHTRPYYIRNVATMTTQQKTDTLHIRMKPGVKKVAQELADEEHRKLSNWIEAVILEKASEKGKKVDLNDNGERS